MGILIRPSSQAVIRYLGWFFQSSRRLTCPQGTFEHNGCSSQGPSIVGSLEGQPDWKKLIITCYQVLSVFAGWSSTWLIQRSINKQHSSLSNSGILCTLENKTQSDEKNKWWALKVFGFFGETQRCWGKIVYGTCFSCPIFRRVLKSSCPHRRKDTRTTLPERNSSPQKIMFSKFGISFSRGRLSGVMLVSGRVEETWKTG